MGKLLEAKLRAALNACPSVGDIRGRDLFWAVEFVKDKKSKETFDSTSLWMCKGNTPGHC
ncbi:hypothetical protein LLEC1_00693 [Akanthomyces lecanii]|uniref:Uncharacterized protein n=1 Tax=Cordyceps confragosa TaxID=2714763 RepID=A0A179IM52_CORDF|nr:hypothetical protein LLEC1_00693 [Akanthomyces lecanii]